MVVHFKKAFSAKKERSLINHNRIFIQTLPPHQPSGMSADGRSGASDSDGSGRSVARCAQLAHAGS
eukprot:6214561-Pleurochrysis_carterae.AAC.2